MKQSDGWRDRGAPAECTAAACLAAHRFEFWAGGTVQGGRSLCFLVSLSLFTCAMLNVCSLLVEGGRDSRAVLWQNASRGNQMSQLHFLPSVPPPPLPPVPHTSIPLTYFVILHYPSIVPFFHLTISFDSLVIHRLSTHPSLHLSNSSFGAFASTLLISFLFGLLSRAPCLSLQDGAVHP